MNRFVALLVAAIGCTRGGTVPPQAESTDPRPIVTMSRGPCYGTCPQYTVNLDAAGAVTFIGYAHTAHVGAVRGAADVTRAQNLLLRLERELPHIAERYVAGEASCGLYHTDAPQIEITLVTPRLSRRIIHNQGCGGAPPSLRALENAIDSVAGTSRWLR